MINKLNHMFSRLSAQFLKPTLALLASLAVGAIGSVWASGTGYEDWTPEVQDSDGDYLVSNPLNWYGTEGAGCNPSWALRFDGETGYVTFDQMMEIGHYIWVGKVAGSSYGANWLVWKSKDGTTSYGFNQGSEKFCIADNDGQEARLKIESGRYTTATESNTGRGMLLGSGTGTADFWQTGGELIVNGKAVMGGGSGTCSVTLDGGVFAANTITRDGGTGTLTFTLNGGTIKSLADSSDFIASGISITVGSNGGTIDVGENAVTIAATLTGAGPIIKKGSGTLMFTGDMSGFTGSIINAEGGVVKLPTGAAATAGVGTSKTDDGSNAIFASTAYAWTGAANDGNWSTPGNWAVGGIQAASYPGSSGGATTEPTENVYIGKKVAITLSSDKKAYVYSIRLGEEVTFTGGGEIFLERSLGPGMLRLNGISLQVPRCGRSDRATGKLEIHNDVEICGDSTNYLGVYKNSDNNYAQTATIYGNLRGSGKLEVEVTGTSGTGFNWYNRSKWLMFIWGRSFKQNCCMDVCFGN